MPITDLNQITDIDIEFTSHCNLHCPQCARFDQLGCLNKYLNLQHLSLYPILQNLELDKLSFLIKITLEGDHGDPVMNPYLAEFVQRCPEHIMIEIVTNASLRSPVWWGKLAGMRKNLRVIFSIDGLADTNAIYRIGSDFQKIVRNAKAFIAGGGCAIWKMIVFKHNEHQIEQARQFSTDLGFSEFKHHISDRNFYDDRSWPIMVEGRSQGMLEMSSMIGRGRMQTHKLALNRINHAFQPVQCKWAAKGEIYIDHLGNVIPCCMTSGLMWRRDISGQLWQKIVGNLTDINLYHHTLSEILQSDFYQTHLRRSLESKTEIHHVCVGNCG